MTPGTSVSAAERAGKSGQTLRRGSLPNLHHRSRSLAVEESECQHASPSSAARSAHACRIVDDSLCSDALTFSLHHFRTYQPIEYPFSASSQPRQKPLARRLASSAITYTPPANSRRTASAFSASVRGRRAIRATASAKCPVALVASASAETGSGAVLGTCTASASFLGALESVSEPSEAGCWAFVSAPGPESFDDGFGSESPRNAALFTAPVSETCGFSRDSSRVFESCWAH